jgi:hypothetical protein
VISGRCISCPPHHIGRGRAGECIYFVAAEPRDVVIRVDRRRRHPDPREGALTALARAAPAHAAGRCARDMPGRRPDGPAGAAASHRRRDRSQRMREDDVAAPRHWTVRRRVRGMPPCSSPPSPGLRAAAVRAPRPAAGGSRSTRACTSPAIAAASRVWRMALWLWRVDRELVLLANCQVAASSVAGAATRSEGTAAPVLSGQAIF